MTEISWTTIKNQYPNAHNSFCKYIEMLDLNADSLHIGNSKNYKNYVENNSRQLYTFFERKQKIAVDVQIDRTRIGYGYPLYAWLVCDFINENTEKFKELERFRLEAEMVAFEHAFKLLEKRNNEK